MEIDVLRLVPNHWSIEEFSENLIKLHYKTKGSGGHQRKPVIVPKKISITEDFISGIAMYLGDGKLAKDGHLAYASKDIDIAKHILHFFKQMNQPPSNINFYIYYRDYLNLADWIKELSLSREQIYSHHGNRFKHPVMIMQLSSVILRELFGKILDETLKLDLINIPALRRAFLRGIFAAEGCIGVAKDSPKPYINCISFSLSYYEDYLSKLITDALNLENVKWKLIKDIADHSMKIQIFGWDNYWKLWRANIFGLCERKQNRFENIAKRLLVNCFLKENFRRRMFFKTKLMQKELAYNLNSWQSNVSKMISGEISISIERLLTLAKLSGVSLNQIKSNIEKISVGSLTPIKNKEFIDLILNIKI